MGSAHAKHYQQLRERLAQPPGRQRHGNPPAKRACLEVEFST